MIVDQNGNGAFGDSGDFSGYFNGDGFGTVKAAAISPGGAEVVPVPPPGFEGEEPADTGLNFALAVVP